MMKKQEEIDWNEFLYKPYFDKNIDEMDTEELQDFFLSNDYIYSKQFIEQNLFINWDKLEAYLESGIYVIETIGNLAKVTDYFDEEKTKIRGIACYKEGKRHRANGPAYTHYLANGKKDCELYYIEDICHRDDGPAYIIYNDDELPKELRYYKNGKLIKIESLHYKNGELIKKLEVSMI